MCWNYTQNRVWFQLFSLFWILRRYGAAIERQFGQESKKAIVHGIGIVHFINTTKRPMKIPGILASYMLYREYNTADTDAVRAAFEDLYQRMHGMLLWELDRIVDVVCALCTEHEKAGVTEGIKVGVQLDYEMSNVIP